MFAWLLSKLWPWTKSDTVKEPGDAAPSCHSDIRLDSEPHQSPPPQSLTKAGIEGVSISDSCSSFLYIPSKITVAILEYLRDDKSSLLILRLVNKLFNELVTPLIHESVDLRCHEYHEPGCIVGRVNSNRMLKRQMCYLVNVTHHPKYLNMVQHLGWEFAAAPWAVFPKMINIQSIDITMNGAFIGGGRIVPVFPNLRKARLAGIFYPGSLECMLLTSPLLTELHLVDMAVC
ncbi:hypothetical protein FRC03_010951 [Tulasnella sp. 419]|nr:hypothetical protein FRC03_010951 [Tulasnella sp. 419]